MSTISKFGAYCGLVAMLAVSGFAQIIPTVISGVLIGKDGKPVVGAEIHFQRTDIKAEYKIKSGKDGKYAYPTLPQGKYDVSFLVGGVEVNKASNIFTDPKKPFELNVDLSKAVGAQVSGTGIVAGPTAPKPVQQPTGQSAEQAAKANAEQAAKMAEYEKQKKAADEKLSTVQGFFNAGMEAYAAKDWNAAIENLIKASAVDVKIDVVWANLGDAYAQRAASLRGADRVSDYQKAAETWAKAVALKPMNANYHNYYALALAGEGKLDEAKVEFEQAAMLDPPQAGLYYRNMGSGYFDAGKNELAEAAYRKAIAADASNPDGYYKLGLSLIARATGPGADGKMIAPAGTAEAFQKYLDLAPMGADAGEAHDMLAALGSAVATGYKNPDAASKSKSKAKSK